MHQTAKLCGIFCLLLVASMPVAPASLSAYSANKAWMEILDSGLYRVGVQYTVPALKEFREAHAVFKSKKEADAFYWHLIRGGEFSVNGPAQMRFIPPKAEPTPW